jgi:hypothetical protein
MSTYILVRDAEPWIPDASYHAPSSYHYEALTAIAATFLALAIAFTSIRFFVRGYMIRALGWDDWLILLALNSFVCQAAFIIHIAWMLKTHNLELVKHLSSTLEVGENHVNVLHVLTTFSTSFSSLPSIYLPAWH